MVKIFVMNTCPDCTEVKRWAEGDERFLVIDIGEHVRNLKEFLKLRDNHPKFKFAREHGLVGIPAFVKEDGTVTFKAEEVGLVIAPAVYETGASCSIDDTGC